MNTIQIKPYYHNIIVGAGIVGAGTFRDLSGHGLSTLIIDKKDFCSQTSASSSKMLHGGIRYLENMDFPLVHEALHEKNLWLMRTPHLVQERPFYLPVFKDSIRPFWMIRIGLWLYDLLSGFKNSPHSSESPSEVMKSLSGIRSNSLKGAGIYHDCVVDDVKLGLELIYDGLKSKHSDALSHCELVDINVINGKLIELKLIDNLTNEEYKTSCQELVLATGPFTDKLLQSISKLNWSTKMVPSKGSHLWLKKEKFSFDKSVVLTPKDGRVIFLIPYENKVLLGTTETIVKDVEFDMKVSQEEVDYLIQNVNEFFPGLGIDHNDILSTFAGIRPLVKEDAGTSLGEVARVHKYFQPYSNIHVMIGGKYTTFRKMAMDVVKVILDKSQLNYNESISIKKPIQESIFLPFSGKEITKEMVLNSAQNEVVRNFEDLVKRRIGISSRSHWDEKTSFNDFFFEIENELSKYITITSEDISSFK